MQPGLLDCFFLADFLKIPRKKLTHILYVKKVENCYRSFEVPKKNGGTRRINAPADDLKSIQLKLSDALAEYQKHLWNKKGISPNIAHAFIKEKSIFSNAKVHRNKRYVLNIDLTDFFDSFHFGRVRGFFNKNNDFQLPIEVATVIAQLTCYNGKLPQGAPSSPIITNLICNILDMRLLKIAKKYRVDYTRYADDMTFSTNDRNFLDNYNEFFYEINKEVTHAGFSINDSKTRLQYRNSRQEVTGLTVNKKLNIDYRYYKETRAMAHNLYTKHRFNINGEKGSINQLEGRFSFINQIDKYNNNLTTDKIGFRFLNGREKQYRQFLFYKYFYYNDMPLIVTEGKTDIVYLKAALKNMYAEYPNLVEKNDDGEFEFKISFFKKSKRINFLFGISRDGADSMKNLYNYFSLTKSKENSYINYYSYFEKLCKYHSLHPVILIFDNESSNKKKPLHNFINHVSLTQKQKEKLGEDLVVHLIDDTNLFLTTNPLVKGKSECEIEDLFDDSTLATNLNGKIFCPKDSYDTNKYFGKDIFSKYVAENYNNIDFSNFKPMLDNINQIIESYHLLSEKDRSKEKELITI